MSDADFTGGCNDCGEVVRLYKINSTQEDGFVIHIERSSLTGRRKEDKEEKKKYRQRIEKVVSALRNSSGGILLIHIHGQRQGDKYLEYFDEFISDSLHHMTDHGELYTNTYKRHWLNEISAFRAFHDFVLLKVSKSLAVATLDFNTKIRSDHENKSPLLCNVLNIISKSIASHTEATESYVILQEEALDVQKLHESRSIELKAFRPANSLRDARAFVDFIWDDLKLKYNITALSKVAEGGFYYVGISENIQQGAYVTKTLSDDGFTLAFATSEIEQVLRGKILHSTIAYRAGSGFVDTPSDLVDIQFIPISRSPRYILQLFVRYFEGIIFNDREGPRTYTLNEDKQINRMPKEQWHRMIHKSADSAR